MQIESAANFQRNYLHTKLITFFRALAAVEVFVGHMRNQFFPDYKTVAHPSLIFKALVFSTGYGPQAVILFFVMSGWLVGGSLLNKRHDDSAFGIYFVDRITRLWVVLIPTMLVSLLVGLVLNGVLGVTSLIEMKDLGVGVFFGNLLGVQNSPLCADYGGNYSLWSLANETWYYVAFPLILLPFQKEIRTSRKPWALVALVALGFLLPGKLVSYMLIWLLGVVFSRVKFSFNRAQILTSLAVLTATSLVIRWHRWDGSLGPDFVLGLVFAIFLAGTKFEFSLPVRWQRGERAANLVSEMSYSLYALHVPIMLLLVGLSGLNGKTLDQAAGRDWLFYASFLFIVFVTAYVFYRLFEAKTYAVRRFVKSRVVPGNALAKVS